MRTMNHSTKKNCGACRWWSPLPEQPFIGVCGHRENAGGATDRVDTCGEFEEKEDEE